MDEKSATNPTIEAMLLRKSIRKYRPDTPPDAEIAAVVRAGQQAPFAMQLGSLLLSRDRDHNPFHAPLLFTVCVDVYRHERVMARRGWKMAMNDLSLLLFGIQDATLMAENMVMAAESLAMGSCFLGNTPYEADEIIAEYGLPPRVFPLVQLAMGYPAEDLPPRPRYPMTVTLHEGRYHEPDEALLTEAMAAMDDGYLAQGYYLKLAAMIPLEDGRQEPHSYNSYSWTEHISRKTGQWLPSVEPLLEQLARCGFHLGDK